jgi:hypothetical protein
MGQKFGYNVFLPTQPHKLFFLSIPVLFEMTFLDVSNVVLTIAIENEIFKDALGNYNTAEYYNFTEAFEKQVQEMFIVAIFFH